VFGLLGAAMTWALRACLDYLLLSFFANRETLLHHR